jgi:hypothetical protein
VREKRNVHKIFIRKSGARRELETLTCKWGTELILRCIINKQDARVSIGFICLRIEISGELL